MGHFPRVPGISFIQKTQHNPFWSVLVIFNYILSRPEIFNERLNLSLGLSWWLSGRESPAVQEMWVASLGWEGLLEKELATHSSILAREIPWTEEPGRL